MRIRDKASLQEYFVLGYNKGQYFFTNMEDGGIWGGFFWQEKGAFEIIDDDTSYLIGEFDDYRDSNITNEKTVRFIIPEFTLSELRKISLDPDNAHIFWNQEFLDEKLTAISYVERALRKYPIRVDQLKKTIENSFEDICLNYLKGYLEGILDQKNFRSYSVEAYWQVLDNDHTLPDEGGEIFEQDALIKKLKEGLDFDKEFICRNIALHLHAVFNFEMAHYVLKTHSEFHSLYYFNIKIYSATKCVKFEIDIPLP